VDVLYKSGFSKPTLSWLKSYLSNRVQFVKVVGFKSATVNVPSGVPQRGHIYSPLLFSLFVNEKKYFCPKVVNFLCLLTI